MLRNGRTGHTWHLVVFHIMLVLKMKSSSPANRPVKRIYVHTCTKKKKKVAIYSRLSPASRESRRSMVKFQKKKKLCLSVDLLNDYMRFFTGLYCESLI